MYTLAQKVILMSILIYIPFFSGAQSSREIWETNLRSALRSGDTAAIKSFYSDDFGDREMDSWKYELERGYLNFNESRLIRLDSNAVLVHIPTNDIPYDGVNHDVYFDFIYRIYGIRESGKGYALSERLMDTYKADFINYKLNIDVDTATHTFLFDCNILADIRSPHLLFRLAKDFEILDFHVNGKNAAYDRFGYFLHSITGTTGIQHIDIRGKLRSPQTNNQFISMDNRSFFIRLGGFAAVPSPPPGNSGRYFFSEDSTEFNITYTYPEEYTLLQYGDPSNTVLLNGQKQTKASISGEWMDEIAFYAQKDWEKKEIVRGKTRIGFYYNKKDEKERDLIISEVDTLVRWIDNKFDNYGNFEINFVVLNSFVKGGLLNDGR